MQLGAALLVLVATWVVAKLFRRAIQRFLRSRHLAEADPGAVTRFKMIARLGSAAIYFVGLGIALYVVNVAAFQKVAVAMFASAGVLGIAIGFASQTTAANLVSGILIAFAQPLRLGDRVEVEQEQGSVEEIGLLYTTIRTWDNRHVMIPNQLLSSRVIRNYSVRDPRSPAVVTFGLGQDADLDWVRSMAIEEARAHADSLDDPAPSVDVVAVDKDGMTVRLVAWAIDSPHAVDLTVALRERVVRRLTEAGVSMSAPAPPPAASPVPVPVPAPPVIRLTP
jgi:small-conductance mechanosensitive channel